MAVTVRSGANACRPFALDVMVFSPESGYKFDVSVEKDCNSDNTETWKLNFNLDKISNGNTVHLVHVSFTATTPEEATGLKSMAFNGVNGQQASTLANQVYPAAKSLEGVSQPSQQQQQDVRNAMQQVSLQGS